MLSFKTLTALSLWFLPWMASTHPLIERENSLPAKYAKVTIYGYSGYNNCDPENIIWYPSPNGNLGVNPVIEDFTVQPEGYVNSFGELASVQMTVEAVGVDGAEVFLAPEGCSSSDCMTKIADSKGFSICASPKVGKWFTTYMVKLM